MPETAQHWSKTYRKQWHHQLASSDARKHAPRTAFHTWSSCGCRALASASNAFAAWLPSDDVSPFGTSSDMSAPLLLSRSLPIVASVVTTLASVLRSAHTPQLPQQHKDEMRNWIKTPHWLCYFSCWRFLYYSLYFVYNKTTSSLVLNQTVSH